MAESGEKAKSGAGNGKDGNDEEAREDAAIKHAEETMREMRAAMNTMMGSSLNMMQAFIDMRLSWLKAMRAGLEDPRTAIDIMTKNLRDTAEAINKSGRKE